MTKVSVIVPVYNVEKFIPRCLDSLINQTLKDIEIICINDGSTDNSFKVLQQYALKDNRIILISQENKGPGAARNRGLEVAKGEYIAFADPDDWVELNAYEELYNKAVELNAQILMFDYNYVGERNSARFSYADDFKEKLGYDLAQKQYIDQNDIENFLFDLSVYLWDKIYSKKFIDKYKISLPEVYINEDTIFNRLCYCNADRVYYINKSYYNYYIMRLSSMVNTYFDPSFSIFEVTNSCKKFIDENMPHLAEKYEHIYYTRFVYCYLLMPFYAFKKRRTFLKKYLKYFGQERYATLLKIIKSRKEPFYKQIFSIKRMFVPFKHRELTILGFKFRYEKKKSSPKTKILKGL